MSTNTVPFVVPSDVKIVLLMVWTALRTLVSIVVYAKVLIEYIRTAPAIIRAAGLRIDLFMKMEILNKSYCINYILNVKLMQIYHVFFF